MASVAVADAADWLTAHRGEGPVVTSLPDAEEVGLTIAEWRPKFHYWATLCLDASREACVFVQTDRKHDCRIESKAGMVLLAAERLSIPTIWHKVASWKPPGSIDLRRPTISHVIAFGTCKPGRPRPDQLTHGKHWRNGVGEDLADFLIDWLEEVAPDGPIVNPFCGKGTFLRAATAVGRESFGCDQDPERVYIARAARE